MAQVNTILKVRRGTNRNLIRGGGRGALREMLREADA
jgi:hypothetical protein